MFKVGDVVTIRSDVDLEEVDFKMGIRGKTVTILDIEMRDDFDIYTDYDGGWWIMSSAIAGGLSTKSKIERKIAFMDKRFKERNNV